MNSLLQKQPEFFLRISARDTKYFIRINDVAVYREFDAEGELEMDLPVNSYMCSGKNTIRLQVLPNRRGEKINSDSEIAVELWVRPHHPKKELEGYKLTDIKFDGYGIDDRSGCGESLKGGRFSLSDIFSQDENGDIEISDIEIKDIERFQGGLEFVRSIDVLNSLPHWAFFQSDELPDYSSYTDDEFVVARKEIYDEIYVKFQQALENEDVDAILEMCDERNREMDQAFYFKPGTYAEMQRESLELTFEDENLELVPLYENLSVIREENGFLVSLCRRQCEPAIGFDFVEGIGSIQYPIMCRRQNGKWIIAR